MSPRVDPLLVERRDTVCWLRLNRPDRRNALNDELTRRLRTALAEADTDRDVRAIVLAGAGPSFCAGADTSEFARFRKAPPEAVLARADLTTGLHAAFATLSKPVVGAVRGHALGGGAGLALACDLLVLADTAVIGYPELTHGIVAAVVMANLVRQVGRKTAFELVALAQPIPASRALALGMANRVVPDAAVEVEAGRLAEALARHDPLAMATTRRVFYRAADLPLDAALQVGRDANVLMRSFAPRGSG